MTHDETLADWRERAERALKGAPFETLLYPLQPLTGEPGSLWPLQGASEPLYAGRAQGGRWALVQRVDDDTDTAAQALEDLENGATGLALVFSGAPGAYGRGLVANDVAALDDALDGVGLDLIETHIEAGEAAPAALALVLALCERRGTRPLALHAGIDPIGAAAAAGRTPDLTRLGEAVTHFAEAGLSGTVLRADGRIAAEAGATPADEVAFAAGTLVAMLETLDRDGLEAQDALPLVSVALSADAQQFVTIAKLRAMRRLHQMVADACGVSVPLTLHATTSARMLSRSDPETNLLRLTLAAMGAAQGGADAITVLPFDAAASPFARRMARNIQSLMLEEAHVARLDDPGAGAGAIEALTDAIAEAAWSSVRENGEDLVATLTDGTFARRAAKAREADEARTIIGVTKHPPKTRAAATPAPPPKPRDGAPANAPLAELLAIAKRGDALFLGQTDAAESVAEPLSPTRLAARHEE